MLFHKGFIGQIDFDSGSSKLVGEVVNSIDIIEFYGETALEIKQDFEKNVDDYINFHKIEIGVKPIPFVGNFTICLSTNNQSNVIKESQGKGVSISHWLNQQVDAYLNQYFKAQNIKY